MNNNILSHWDIEYNKVSIKNSDMSINQEIEPHIWQIDNTYFLKCVESAEIIEDLYTISEILYKSDIPVAIPIITKKKKLFVTEGDKFYFLMHNLQGKTFVNFNEYNWDKYGYLVGQSIARFHLALRKCESIANNKIMDNYKDIINWAVPKIKNNIPADVTDKIFSLLDEYKAIFSVLYYKLPRQLIHNDLHGHNILFQDEKLTGIVDLDSCMQNARIFDTINFSAWLLYCMRDDRTKWLSSLYNILCGYSSIINFTLDETNSIFYMLYSLGLRYIAVFYNTSVDFLVQRGIDALNWIIDNRRLINEIEKKFQQ